MRHGRQIACCGTCVNTRGLIKKHLIDDATRCYPLALMLVMHVIFQHISTSRFGYLSTELEAWRCSCPTGV